ncbi:MAG: radical SAM protein [Chloroflexi bacterium]|nr:radical SAM protein [Chloroflexota bacterium]
MEVLCIIPPHVPSYFNAGHHLPVFQVAAYLRHNPFLQVTARDFAALNATWRDVCRLLARKFDVIAMLNDYDAVDGFERFISYARQLSPRSKLMTFGRASREVPSFFDQFGLDGIGSSGDYETSVADFIKFVMEGRRASGLRLRGANGRYTSADPGRWLSAEDWALPDISEIPYEKYDALYKDDGNKFCGIPGRRELIVPVARGCSVECLFCDVPKQQGRHERRMTVPAVIDYISECYRKGRFDYVSFYAPTFTLRKQWVQDLCEAMLSADLGIRWKCVTTVSHLDAPLVRKMAQAGCVRISVGVESFAPEAAAILPKLKQESKGKFLQIANMCKAANVELNCFLMLGIPGEPVKRAVDTMKALCAAGHRVRPTIYTQYDRMRGDMTVAEFATFNRQLLRHHTLSDSDLEVLYQNLYASDFDVPTQVARMIPKSEAKPRGPGLLDHVGE